MIFGIIGTVLLVFAFCAINIDRFKNKFFTIDLIATLFLLIHAIDIKDISFIVVNSFIMIMLSVKLYKKNRKLK